MSSKRRALTKLLAILLMTGNHAAHIFLPLDSALAQLFIGLGYFTAPLMCMYLVDGYYYTRSRKAYFSRLLFTALLSQYPFWLAFHGGQLNMLFSLSFCFLLIAVSEGAVEQRLRRPLLIGIFLICSLFSDWSAVAPAMTLLFLRAEGIKKRKAIAFLFACLVLSADTLSTGIHRAEAPAELLFRLLCVNLGPLLALLLAWHTEAEYTLPDSRARSAKHAKSPAAAFPLAAGLQTWFFYLYYPLHLLLLVFLRARFFTG